jgi:hypothetical protein
VRGALVLDGATVTAAQPDEPALETFPVHLDPRGMLIAVEGADVGFPVQRVFVVRGADPSLPRGGHAPGCRELLVLVSGRATGSVRSADTKVVFDLTAAGQSVRVDPTDRVDYVLDPDSVLLVLCDRPYGETS